MSVSVVIEHAAMTLCEELGAVVRGEEVLSFDETYARIEHAQNNCLRQLAATDLWGRDNQIPSSQFWKKAGWVVGCGPLQRHAREKPRGYAGDFEMLGKAMIQNTEAQGRLNDALISPDARRIIDIAREHGAIGWKVNGAGGDGGSLTLLCNDSSSAKRALIGEVESDNNLFKNIPIYLSRTGLRTWDRSPG